ncbi:MAG: hypothetical protein MZV63_27555 [Marinilabiliales bacterium]|nr:hypothetical protein [Marinilabiliales bacterium]
MLSGADHQVPRPAWRLCRILTSSREVYGLDSSVVSLISPDGDADI